MSEVVITVRGEHETRDRPRRSRRPPLGARRRTRTRRSRRADGVARRPAPRRPRRPARMPVASREWSSQRVAVWANRPWNSEGKQLALVHYASVEFTATFTDFASLSWWVTDVAERDGVQVDGVDVAAHSRHGEGDRGGCRGPGRQGRGRARDRVRRRDRARRRSRRSRSPTSACSPAATASAPPAPR